MASSPRIQSRTITCPRILLPFHELMKYLDRYKRAKQELQGTSSPQKARRGRPRTVHPILAMEQPLAASALAEHAAHCRGSLQTRAVCKESRLFRRRLKEAFFKQKNQYINWDRRIVEQDDPLPEPDEHELDKYYKAEDTELDSATTTDRRQMTPILPQRAEDRRLESYRRDTLRTHLTPHRDFKPTPPPHY
ncbi:hypothetical protein M513_12421 [Trichuris suis]|uniref:Uncharacterized protein n=1 Tax=Trichuris suis TaxID=68888 RepID=A0A085LP15_9BILA|nr:hypothetical protein M513_12421 [Trichuris suis]